MWVGDSFSTEGKGPPWTEKKKKRKKKTFLLNSGRRKKKRKIFSPGVKKKK